MQNGEGFRKGDILILGPTVLVLTDDVEAEQVNLKDRSGATVVSKTQYNYSYRAWVAEARTFSPEVVTSFAPFSLDYVGNIYDAGLTLP